MNAQQAAAKLARILRANPNLWARCDSGGYGEDQDTRAVCLIGHLGRLGVRHELAVIEAFAKHVPRQVGLSREGEMGQLSAYKTDLMLWNDSHKVEDIIALCDKVAATETTSRSDSALVADLIERVVGQTVSTEAVSEELTWA